MKSSNRGLGAALLVGALIVNPLAAQAGEAVAGKETLQVDEARSRLAETIVREYFESSVNKSPDLMRQDLMMYKVQIELLEALLLEAKERQGEVDAILTSIANNKALVNEIETYLNSGGASKLLE